MSKYRVAANIERASGTQYWTVEADNPEEALLKHKKGESEFEFEELEVTELSDPELADVEDISDEPGH